MKPTIDPSGVCTVAGMIPSPTSIAGACFEAPALSAASTALATSSTPQ